MKLKIPHFVSLPFAAIAVCINATAATWEGDDVTFAEDWHTATNWSTDPDVPGVALIGEDVEFNVGDNDTIDLNGVDASVGQFYIRRKNQTFLTTGGPATVTCTELRWQDRDTGSVFDINLDINGEMVNGNKSGNATFNGTVDLDSFDLGQTTFTFNDAVTHTPPGADQLSLFYRGLSIGNDGPTAVFNSTLTAPNGVSVGAGARKCELRIGADNTLSGLGGVLDVNAGSVLNFQVTPASPADFGTGSVAVNAGGLLVGNPGDATWGPAADIDVKTDAILALDSGATEPTPGEIGTDVALQGVVGNGTWTAGTDGTTIYKGLALGPFSGNLTSKTLVAPAGAGSPEIVVLSGTANAPVVFNVESTDGTGMANFRVRGPLLPKNGFRLNSDPATGNQVTTFNMIGEGGGPAAVILSPGNTNTTNSQIYADQTYNFSGEGTVQTASTDVKGALTFSDDTMYTGSTYQFQDSGTLGYENTSLTFNDGTAYSIANGEEEQFELLTTDFAAQVIQNGQTFLCLEGRDNAVQDINATENPNLIEFMKKSTICIYEQNNDDTSYLGEGPVIGDGKYFLSFHSKGYHKLSAEPFDAGTNPFGPAKLNGVSGAATMGIANISSNTGRSLEFFMSIDGNGAKILANNLAVMEYVEPGDNSRQSRAPEGKIDFSGPIEDTPGMDILNGNIDFNDGVTVPAGFDLMVGSGATVNMDVSSALTIDVLSGNGTVNDADLLDFSTVAPGASVGQLNLDASFTVPDGSTYAWEIGGTGGVAGTDYDVIVANTVTFGGAWNLDISNTGLADNALDGSEVFILVDSFTANSFAAPVVTGADFDVSGVTVSVGTGDDAGRILMTGLVGPIGGGGGNDFSDWIAGFPGVGAEAGFGDDPDGDGIESGLENFLGTDPSVFSSGLTVSGLDTAGPVTFTFTHPQNPSPADDVSAPAYRWSTDLMTFNPDGATIGATTVSFVATPDTPVVGTTTVIATIVGTVPTVLGVDLSVSQLP